MRVLVPSALENRDSQTEKFAPVIAPAKVTASDTQGRDVVFTVDTTGTSGKCNGISYILPEYVAVIKNVAQLELVLAAHNISPTVDGTYRFSVRTPTAAPTMHNIDGAKTSLFDIEASCGGVGCATVGCSGATSAGGGCAAAGCASVGCAGAGCAAVGCATVDCAAAGKGVSGCAGAACAAVGCGAAGCGAAACGAVGCLAAGCATVACGAADGACGGAACALDALCGANAGWPP